MFNSLFYFIVFLACNVVQVTTKRPMHLPKCKSYFNTKSVLNDILSRARIIFSA